MRLHGDLGGVRFAGRQLWLPVLARGRLLDGVWGWWRAALPDPVALTSNDLFAFMGAGLGGSGFILDAAEYSMLVAIP